MTDAFNTYDSLPTATGKAHFVSLKKLEHALGMSVSRLPVSIRIVLESVLRNCDGVKVTPEHVKQLAAWKPNAERTEEIPFTVARVILQDFTGVPLLADLAAMRSAAARAGRDPKKIEPLVPVDMVVDHSSRWCRPASASCTRSTWNIWRAASWSRTAWPTRTRWSERTRTPP